MVKINKMQMELTLLPLDFQTAYSCYKRKSNMIIGSKRILILIRYDSNISLLCLYATTKIFSRTLHCTIRKVESIDTSPTLAFFQYEMHSSHFCLFVLLLLFLTFYIINELTFITLTHNNNPKFIVYTRVYSWL